jgi:hypothetical protein
MQVERSLTMNSKAGFQAVVMEGIRTVAEAS